MTLSAVFLVSSDEWLGRHLRDAHAESWQIIQTTELSGVPAMLGLGSLHLIVFDLRRPTGSDSAAQRTLTALLEQHPALPIIVLGPALVPVWMSEHVSTGRIEVIAGMTHVAMLEERIVAALQPVAPQPSVVPSAPETVTEAPRRPGSKTATFGEAIFEGSTRRFETRSPELKQMLDDLMIAAAHDVTILLIGETGSGKTFLSNLIHESSPRRQEPFLHVACGALPRELIESELFGHTRGSFTSAHADKDGKFVAARRGTVLLDEIDVLGPEQQVKLLRVIETGEFEPVGSNVTLRLQARLVVASNLDLQPLVEHGKFRPDLYYRLNMLKFEIPPLRRRRVDIIPLAKKFIDRFSQKHQMPIHRIDDSVLDALLAYPWPGNVRELEHVIQRAVIYCRDGVLTRDQLPSHILSGHAGPTNDPSVRLGTALPGHDHTLERQVSLSEKEIIEQALCRNNFSRTRTAKDLGISRVTLYNKMKKYEMLNS